MPALDHSSSALRDYSISGPSARVAIAHGSSYGPSAERSDPYMEWALRFDQSLRRVEERIRTWSRSSAVLEEEDLEAPSQEAVARAMEITNILKVLVMDRVAPATATLLDLRGASLASGGEISLELGAGPFAFTYRIESDGSVMELFFKNSQLIRRSQIPR